jgi:hypothetical protein
MNHIKSFNLYCENKEEFYTSVESRPFPESGYEIWTDEEIDNIKKWFMENVDLKPKFSIPTKPAIISIWCDSDDNFRKDKNIKGYYDIQIYKHRDEWWYVTGRFDWIDGNKYKWKCDQWDGLIELLTDIFNSDINDPDTPFDYKLMEGFNTEDYYTKINIFEYNKLLFKHSKFDEKDRETLEDISKLLECELEISDDSWIARFKYTDERGTKFATNNGEITKPGIKYMLAFVNKLKNDYHYYKCDQLEGLEMLIDDNKDKLTRIRWKGLYESANNSEYYQQITPQEYLARHKTANVYISSNYLKEINSKLVGREFHNRRHLMYGYIFRYDKQKEVTMGDRTFTSNFSYDVTISECADEWWLVRVYGISGNGPNINTHFKCDQFEGLLVFLDDMFHNREIPGISLIRLMTNESFNTDEFYKEIEPTEFYETLTDPRYMGFKNCVDMNFKKYVEIKNRVISQWDSIHSSMDHIWKFKSIEISGTHNLTIYEGQDEWFYVVVSGDFDVDKRTIKARTIKAHTYYKCDQFEGLEKLLQDFKIIK